MTESFVSYQSDLVCLDDHIQKLEQGPPSKRKQSGNLGGKKEKKSKEVGETPQQQWARLQESVVEGPSLKRNVTNLASKRKL
jgi:hypothetical protein